MNRNFLLDTNIISESIKRQPDETFLDNFRQNLEDSAIASVTWHELLDGLYRLPESRRRPSYPDGQIAAIARVNYLILVTRNVSDFVDFEELTIENWFVQREDRSLITIKSVSIFLRSIRSSLMSHGSDCFKLIGFSCFVH